MTRLKLAWNYRRKQNYLFQNNGNVIPWLVHSHTCSSSIKEEYVNGLNITNSNDTNDRAIPFSYRGARSVHVEYCRQIASQDCACHMIADQPNCSSWLILQVIYRSTDLSRCFAETSPITLLNRPALSRKTS